MRRSTVCLVAWLALGSGAVLATDPQRLPPHLRRQPPPSSAPVIAPEAPSSLVVDPRAGLTDHPLFRVSVKAAQTGDFGRARKLLESLPESFRGDSRWVFQHGMLLLELGDRRGVEADRKTLAGLPDGARWASLLSQEMARSRATGSVGTAASGRPPVPTPLLTGDALGLASRPLTDWDLGDQWTLVADLRWREGRLSIDALSVNEGKAVDAGPPARPEERHPVALRGPGGTPRPGGVLRLVAGPPGLIETPGPDGKFTGRFLSEPPDGRRARAHLPLTWDVRSLAVTDANGRTLIDEPVSDNALLEAIGRWRNPGPGRIEPGQAVPPRLLGLARLGPDLESTFGPDGGPTGLWLRWRLAAELVVDPALRRFPDAAAANVSAPIRWALAFPGGPEHPKNLTRDLTKNLAALLDGAGPASVDGLRRDARALDALLDRELAPALSAYRRPTMRPTTSVIDRWRALATLLQLERRVVDVLAASKPGSPWARARAAEALFLLGRFKPPFGR